MIKKKVVVSDEDIIWIREKRRIEKEERKAHNKEVSEQLDNNKFLNWCKRGMFWFLISLGIVNSLGMDYSRDSSYLVAFTVLLFLTFFLWFLYASTWFREELDESDLK